LSAVKRKHEEMHEGPEGELNVRAEKLDAGAVRILREWPNVSDECSRPI
jgi:hypothetical protein